MNAYEPEFEAGSPDCPDWFDDGMRAKWSEMVGLLLTVDGLLTRADGDLLSLYCHAWKRFHQARQQIEEMGLLVEGAKTEWTRNPAIQIEREAFQEIMRLGGLFGLSPSDRAQLKLPPPGKQDDEYATMLKMREAE